MFSLNIYSKIYSTQGWPATAISFVKTSGIANGSSYVYTGVTGKCKRKKFRPFRFKIPNVCSYDLGGDEKKLQALVDQGPVIVCIGNSFIYLF